MENNKQRISSKEPQDDSCCPPGKENASRTWQIVSLVLVGFLITGALVSSPDSKNDSLKPGEISVEEAILPSDGAVLKVMWGRLGSQMTEAGVIDKEKFLALYAQRGGLTNEERLLLEEESNGYLAINSDNAGVLLNLFWALGLANKNSILEEGPMADPRYGGDAGRFASTGGWTLSQGNAMDHYSRHAFVVLSQEQQALVERVAKNIYRPCCGNSTYFPDCNHGMAMLGLLELMASQGVSEEEMYRAALQVNSYWFPDTYLTIAQYFANRGVSWDGVNAKEVLGASYSSAQGYQRILEQVQPPQFQGGGSCGV